MQAGIILRVQKRKAGRLGVWPGWGQVGVSGFPVPSVDLQGLSRDWGIPSHSHPVPAGQGTRLGFCWQEDPHAPGECKADPAF